MSNTGSVKKIKYYIPAKELYDVIDATELLDTADVIDYWPKTFLKFADVTTYKN